MLRGIEREHFEKYWRLSRQFFEEGDHALATFFAITLIEEIGKAVILAEEKPSEPVKNDPFFNHKAKYAYAVMYNLLINSRVSRIYGRQETRFAKWFRNGELFNMRNKSLYLEKTTSGTTVPSEAISTQDACLLVCMAGEVYGESQGIVVGTGPDEWGRIIAEADAFRTKYLEHSE